jgi:hypothetical protein
VEVNQSTDPDCENIEGTRNHHAGGEANQQTLQKGIKLERRYQKRKGAFLPPKSSAT